MWSLWGYHPSWAEPVSDVAVLELLTDLIYKYLGQNIVRSVTGAHQGG